MLWSAWGKRSSESGQRSLHLSCRHTWVSWFLWVLSIYDYWKKDEIFHYYPVASRISRDRFFELHRYLHFADNSSVSSPGDPGYNKVGKVQPVIDHLGEAFRSVYCLPQNVSVDEAMIPFKGRSSLKQYIPLKPVKRGIKV